MRIAIIGSRNFNNRTLVINRITEIINNNLIDQVISGGAKGVDSWVEEVCKHKKININIIRPINPTEKINYLYRNIEIITLADKVYAFWDGKSKGTQFVINYCRARNKPLEIIKENE